ncbi:hypothetical protein [Halocalculus aciditolerans]|nr:hypothetical protein [Halocalculus aciditolerans]
MTRSPSRGLLYTAPPAENANDRDDRRVAADGGDTAEPTPADD